MDTTNQPALHVQNSTMDTTNIKWLPAIPISDPFDVQERIEELRSYLDPNNPSYQPERQHVNINAIIKLYEDGKIDGINEVSVMDGKIISREQRAKGPLCSWTEGTCHQLSQKHSYGQGPFNLGFPVLLDSNVTQAYTRTWG